MEKSLEILNEVIHTSGFNVSETTTIYNPMEEFARHVEKKELVHSKIIADLLNPEGEHGLKRLFLDGFLVSCGCNPADFPSPKIFTEYTLHGGRWDNRRIDILIIDDSTPNINAVIVENKLNEANYQPNQLEDYKEAIEKIFNPKSLTIVCLHRNYVYDKGLADYVLYPQDLSTLISKSTDESKTDAARSLLSYSLYLKNLNISNIDMDNAKILYQKIRESQEALDHLKAIKAAYTKLPLVSAQDFCKQMGVHQAQISKNYNHCVEVKSDRLNQYKLLIAVLFFESSVDFFLICEDSKSHVPTEELELTFDSSAYKQEWYLVDKFGVEPYKFDYLPDFEIIKGKADQIIRKCENKLPDKNN